MQPKPQSERGLRMGPSVVLMAMLGGLGYAAYHFRDLFLEKPPVSSATGTENGTIQKTVEYKAEGLSTGYTSEGGANGTEPAK